MKPASIAYGLLVPAPVVFAVRAALEALGGPSMPGAALAVVGILSGAGMALLIWALRRDASFLRAVIAVTVALSGHYVVARLVDGDLGGAMVYLGTGMAAAIQRPVAVYAGLVAAAGALLRHTQVGAFGQGLLVAGALALAWFLVESAKAAQSRDDTTHIQ